MKISGVIWLCIIFVLMIIFAFFFFQFTGNIISELNFNGLSGQFIGSIAQQEQQCMKNCITLVCSLQDFDCMKANNERCLDECNIEKPESACMRDCLIQECLPYDFSCQEKKKINCEKGCLL